MLTLVPTSQFRRTVERAKRQGEDLRKLEAALELLCARRLLPPRMRDHALKGEYAGLRECHLEPDWLLVYQIDQDELILYAINTGSHDSLGLE